MERHEFEINRCKKILSNVSFKVQWQHINVRRQKLDSKPKGRSRNTEYLSLFKTCRPKHRKTM